MLTVELAKAEDLYGWQEIDTLVSQEDLLCSMEAGRCRFLREDGERIGVLRFNLFRDTVPFLGLLYIHEPYRYKGHGREAMRRWEDEMRGLGYSGVMTATGSDKMAQHFFRKLGYRDAGCLVLDIPRQPLEVVLMKELWLHYTEHDRKSRLFNWWRVP